MNKRQVKRKAATRRNLSKLDAHALACFFALHHGALALSKNIRPGDIERLVMALFGLVEKNGPYRLTERGVRAVQMAQTGPNALKEIK